jgi:hypothetical protein
VTVKLAAVFFAFASVGALVTGCGDDGGRDAETYCGQIQLHLETLNSPSIDDGADITRTLDVYRTITSAAPAAVEPEWQQLLSSLETASTVDPTDPASIQRVADTARSTRPAATKVQQYTDRTCALRIADPPPPTNPVTATTATPGPSTSAPAVTGQGGG